VNKEITTPDMQKWASQFTCTKCGPCTYEMVTADKTCSDCGSLLFKTPLTLFDMPNYGYQCQTPITETGKIELEELNDRIYLLNTIASQKIPTVEEIAVVEKQFDVWWDQLQGLFVTKINRPQFFQRFYAIKPDVLANLLLQYREMFPEVVEVWIKPIEDPNAPPNSHEVVLYFNTIADRNKVRNDPKSVEWYNKNSTTLPGSKFRPVNTGRLVYVLASSESPRTNYSSGTWPPK